jgi:hypothetical protein
MEMQKLEKKGGPVVGHNGSDSWSYGRGYPLISGSRENAKRFEAAHTAAAV